MKKNFRQVFDYVITLLNEQLEICPPVGIRQQYSFAFVLDCTAHLCESDTYIKLFPKQMYYIRLYVYLNMTKHVFP